MKTLLLLLLLQSPLGEGGTGLPPLSPPQAGDEAPPRRMSDGLRDVQAWPLVPQASAAPEMPLGGSGAASQLRPYRLVYPSLPGVEPTAWLGPDAIVSLPAGLAHPEVWAAQRGALWLRWLSPALGLALLRSLDPGEDGLAISGRLRRDAEVGYAMPDLYLARSGAYRPNDPLYSHQWYLTEVEAAAAWDLADGSADIRVAVIDGGVQMDHPDLVDKIVSPWDALEGDDDPSPGDEESQPSHGTSVACVATATTDNNEGVAGACPRCSLIPIRLIHGGLTAISSDVAAFEHALSADADIINNSWGFGEPVPAPLPLLAILGRVEGEGREGRGTVVVFASGNEGREVRSFEVQGQAEVLTVGATDRYGNAERYSNWGAALDLVAPTGAVTCDLGSEYTHRFGGTSSSAPLVTGLLALALAMRPELTADELRALAVGTARKDPRLAFDADGHHDAYGYGAVDPETLLLAVAAMGGEGEGEGDAGPGPDADVGGDAGGAPDGGGARTEDGGGEPQPDGGAFEPDVAGGDGGGSDAALGVLADGGSARDGGATADPDDEGCACGTAGASPASMPTGWLLVLVAALGIGRRRW